MLSDPSRDYTINFVKICWETTEELAAVVTSKRCFYLGCSVELMCGFIFSNRWQLRHPSISPCYINLPMIMGISMFLSWVFPYMEIPMKKTWVYPWSWAFQCTIEIRQGGWTGWVSVVVVPVNSHGTKGQKYKNSWPGVRLPGQHLLARSSWLGVKFYFCPFIWVQIVQHLKTFCPVPAFDRVLSFLLTRGEIINWCLYLKKIYQSCQSAV